MRYENLFFLIVMINIRFVMRKGSGLEKIVLFGGFGGWLRRWVGEIDKFRIAILKNYFAKIKINFQWHFPLTIPHLNQPFPQSRIVWDRTFVERTSCCCFCSTRHSSCFSKYMSESYQRSHHSRRLLLLSFRISSSSCLSRWSSSRFNLINCVLLSKGQWHV